MNLQFSQKITRFSFSQWPWFLVTMAIISFIMRFFFIQNPHLIRDDGSYYALWAKYYLISTPDHPTFIGYMIKPFLFLLGNTRFAYTLPHYLMMAVLTILGTYLINKMSQKKSCWPGIFFALSMSILPYFAGISVIVSTETPLIFFAFLAIFSYFFAFFHHPKKTVLWIAGGFFLAMALFSKLTAIFVMMGIFAYPLLSKKRGEYWKNHRLYLSLLPIIIVAASILIDDYFHNFALIRYTLMRSQRPFSFITQSDVPLGVLFSQFNLFSPLFIIMIPIILTKIIKKYWNQKNIDEKPTSEQFLSTEQQFFLAIASALPFFYAFYKIFTTFLGSYWISFAYPPAILLCCFALAQKWHNNQWKKRILINYLVGFIFICFVYIHTIYGVVDPQFHRVPNRTKSEIAYGYNRFFSKVALFFQQHFHQIPRDNTDRYYDYSALLEQFPDFYRDKMEKDLPIVSFTYHIASIINYFVQPKVFATAFSPKSFPQWNQKIVALKPNIYDYIYDFSALDGKDIYLFVENNEMPVEKLLENLKKYAKKVEWKQTFISQRKGKKLKRLILFRLNAFDKNLTAKK